MCLQLSFPFFFCKKGILWNGKVLFFYTFLYSVSVPDLFGLFPCRFRRLDVIFVLQDNSSIPVINTITITNIASCFALCCVFYSFQRLLNPRVLQICENLFTVHYGSMEFTPGEKKQKKAVVLASNMCSNFLWTFRLRMCWFNKPQLSLASFWLQKASYFSAKYALKTHSTLPVQHQTSTQVKLVQSCSILFQKRQTALQPMSPTLSNSD